MTRIEFYSDGLLLKGIFYKGNEELKKYKTIIMCHGFGGVKELLLPKYAEIFSEEGFDVITFDYRGFGDSEGECRIVPEEQIRDILSAIVFANNLEELKENEIVLWGTSLGGSYALKVSTLCDKVSKVYAQITFSNGFRNNTSHLTEEEINKLKKTMDGLLANEVIKNKSLRVNLKKLLSDKQSLEFLEKYGLEFQGAFNIKLPFTTANNINKFSIDEILKNITVPVLLAQADLDIVNLPSEMEYIYNNLNCDKKLIHIDGGHYDVYEGENFKKLISEQIQWFSK
ncbi:MAG: alpha/beta hydrolase [Cetobacterium sp.]